MPETPEAVVVDPATEIVDEARWAKIRELPSDVLDRALVSLKDGRGAAVSLLATVAGMTRDAIKCRAQRGKRLTPRTEQAVEPPRLDRNEAAYFDRYFKSADDPALKEFMGSQKIKARARPDWRSATDR